MNAVTTRNGEQPRTSIRATIFEITTPAMEVLRLVHYENGEFDILRGSKPIGESTWKDSELEECIEHYRSLVHRIAGAEQDNSNNGKKHRGHGADGH